MSQDIIVVTKNNVQIIKFNRPNKKNSITISMYKRLTEVFRDSANNDDILVTVITGEGDFYSSGNYMGVEDDMILSYSEATIVISKFVEALIDYPKILIAILNGPAIGIAATTLALCDIIYASDKAYIHTPFIKLGLSPEGCSTYTFPKIFGINKATEMLLFGYKMSSMEAFQYGFISELYSSTDMLESIWNKIYSITKLPKHSLVQSKKLLKNFDRDNLLLANKRECDELEERWKSEEFHMMMINFINRANKL